MGKFCPNCGNKLDDAAKFCEKCGMKYVDEEKMSMITMNDHMSESNEESFLKKHGKALIIIVIVLIVAGLLGYFVVYPKVSNYLQHKEDQKEADKVVVLIDSLKDKEITVDSEKSWIRYRLNMIH